MSNDFAQQLLARSARFIDEGVFEGKETNPIGGDLADFGDGLALVTSFSHVIAVSGSQGLNLFDTSLPATADKVLNALRGWSEADIDTLVYTHGHLDHVGGAQRFAEETRERRGSGPRVIAHANVPPRFRRYEISDGYNAAINARQFQKTTFRVGDVTGGRRFCPEWVEPTVTFTDRLEVDLGGHRARLFHHRGETDDHAWAWLPERKAILGGDFVTWVFPNAGNPQKVQRYAAEWAQALRTMASLEAELFLPAHGLPIEGRSRINAVLSNIASALEYLVDQTLEQMNAGVRLDDIVHSVRLPQALAELPYLQPTYDEPEFVIRNIWRLYGGWWDGDPSHLKPAPAGSVATEIAALAGGADRLARRALELAEQGDSRLASHLVEFAGAADPTDPGVHRARRLVYDQRRREERSLMALNIFRSAARASAEIAGSEG